MPYRPSGKSHSSQANIASGLKQSCGQHAGVTLLELLTIVMILSILATIAIPSFVDMVRRNRITSESNYLLSMLMLARSEAIKRNMRITLCKSNDGQSCSTLANVYWHHGIIVFVDANANRNLDAEEIVIRAESAFSSVDKISFTGGDALTYRANGVPSSGGTFTISSGTLQKKVIVSLAGRSRIN